MHIVTRKHLSDAARKYRDALKELTIWAGIAESARWRNFNEVRAIFPDADAVDGYVIFNIRHNRYRLITVIHYAKDRPRTTDGHIYIRSVLKHTDYNDHSKWDPFAHE